MRFRTSLTKPYINQVSFFYYFVSFLKQISLKLGDKVIALVLTGKKRFLSAASKLTKQYFHVVQVLLKILRSDIVDHGRYPFFLLC